MTVADRLQAYLDREEIRDLSRRYMRGLDRLEKDLLASVFAPDATVDYGFFQGSAQAFADFAHSALKDHLANHHMLGQMLIEIDGDRAVGEVYFQAFHRILSDGSEQDLFIAGRYLDRYVRTAHGWRIEFRAEVNDWSRTEPAADTFFQTNTAALRGDRGTQDYSAPFFAGRKGEQQA